MQNPECQYTRTGELTMYFFLGIKQPIYTFPIKYDQLKVHLTLAANAKCLQSFDELSGPDSSLALILQFSFITSCMPNNRDFS